MGKRKKKRSSTFFCGTIESQEDYLIHAHQEIPAWLVKITFLGKAEIAIRLSIKPWFAEVRLNTVTAFWDLLFLFSNIDYKQPEVSSGQNLLSNEFAIKVFKSFLGFRIADFRDVGPYYFSILWLKKQAQIAQDLPKINQKVMEQRFKSWEAVSGVLCYQQKLKLPLI